MEEAREISTPLPMDKNTNCETEILDEQSQQQYRTLVVCLNYLTVTTRPDITFIVHQLCGFDV